MLFRHRHSDRTTTIFLTGGSGFLGRNLIPHLLESGYAVRALVRSKTAEEQVTALGGKAVHGNVLNARELTRDMAGCWAVIHAAADTNQSLSDPMQERVNVEGTRTVFQAARDAGLKRGVHVSSEAVLATGKPIRMADESWPIPQEHPGEYSRTKALAEQAAIDASSDDFEICAIRPRFIWGRDDTTILSQLEAPARSGVLRWVGRKDYLTSTTHVDNAATGVIAALEHGRAKQVYFITDGEPQSFRTFVSNLLKARGINPPESHVPRWALKLSIALGPWLGKISNGKISPALSRQEYALFACEVTADDSLARRELDYTPVMTIEQGLEEMRRNTRQNRRRH